MKSLCVWAVLAGLSCGALPARAEGLAEHTFLVTWAADNCEGFTYAEDLLRHARIEVLSAPETEVTALANKTVKVIEEMMDGDKAEVCDVVVLLIETPEDEEDA